MMFNAVGSQGIETNSSVESQKIFSIAVDDEEGIENEEEENAPAHEIADEILLNEFDECFKFIESASIAKT